MADDRCRTCGVPLGDRYGSVAGFCRAHAPSGIDNTGTVDELLAQDEAAAARELLGIERRVPRRG